MELCALLARDIVSPGMRNAEPPDIPVHQSKYHCHTCRQCLSHHEAHLWLGVHVDTEARGFLLDPGAGGTRQRLERLHRDG